MIGTPSYLSPEQWASSRDVGPATGIWSLGCILFEPLTGRPPYDELDWVELCKSVLTDPPPPTRPAAFFAWGCYAARRVSHRSTS